MNTPRYEYSKSALAARIATLQNLDAPFGVTVRYAMKANPFKEIIFLLHEAGIQFDASSSYEAAELLALGIPGSHISLSSQQSPHNLEALLLQGVRFVATSFKQLQQFIDTPGRPKTVALRINPPVGYGHNNRTSTGGANSSFGLWHEYIPQALELIAPHDLLIDRVHIHIGSGADPWVWGEVMDISLMIMERIPTALTLDIGGGFKVHRFGDEKEADLPVIMELFSKKIKDFEALHKRKLHLEIEPGTYVVASVGTLVAMVDDIVDTGKDGYRFLRLNTGMNDFLRSSLYGAQHHIEVCSNASDTESYVVVGHNCESGDILTPAAGNPEEIAPRMLKHAAIGDEVRIYDVGAYCASMRAKGYNSFPEAHEVMVD
jgi:diaminopimelate decarboxylase